MAMSGGFNTAGLSGASLLPVSGIDLTPTKTEATWNLIQLANSLHTYIKKIDSHLEELKEKEKHEEVQRLKDQMVDLDEGFHLLTDVTHYEIEGSDDDPRDGLEKLRQLARSHVIGKESYKVRMGYVDGDKEQVVIQAKETFIGELSHESDKVVLDDEKDSATLALALAIKFFNLYKRLANKIKSVKETVFEQYKPGSEQDQDHKGVKDKNQRELISEIEKQGLLKSLPKLPELDFEVENLKALLKWVEQIDWSFVNVSEEEKNFSDEQIYNALKKAIVESKITNSLRELSEFKKIIEQNSQQTVAAKLEGLQAKARELLGKESINKIKAPTLELYTVMASVLPSRKFKQSSMSVIEGFEEKILQARPQPSPSAAKRKPVLKQSNELLTYSASNLEEIKEAEKEATKDKIKAKPFITEGLDKSPSEICKLSENGQLKDLHKKDSARSYLKAMGYGILIGAAVGTIFWTWPAFLICVAVGAVAFPVLKKVGSCVKKLFDNCFSWVCGENEEKEFDLPVDDSRDTSPRSSIPYAELPDSTPRIATRLSSPERRQTMSVDQSMAETKPIVSKIGVGSLHQQSLLASKPPVKSAQPKRAEPMFAGLQR